MKPSYVDEQQVIEEYRRLLQDNPPIMAMSHLPVADRIRRMRRAMETGKPLTTYDFIPKGTVT